MITQWQNGLYKNNGRCYLPKLTSSDTEKNVGNPGADISMKLLTISEKRSVCTLIWMIEAVNEVNSHD